jgi:predicted nucleic acid-binding protein
MTRLIDASVVIKWLVSEVGSDSAMKLHGTDLAAPDFMLIELANILWKKARKGEISPAQTALGLTEVETMVETMPTLGLEARALEIALMLGHPVYDCVYLAMAETLETKMTTADQRLLKACAGSGFAYLVEPLS